MTSKELELREENTKLIRENNSLRAFVGNLQTCREREASKIEKLEKENQELKEKIGELFIRDVKPFDVYEEQYKQLEKKYQKLEKVINILRTKLVYLDQLKFGFELYNELVMEQYKLTREEYNLLMEVIINER